MIGNPIYINTITFAAKLAYSIHKISSLNRFLLTLCRKNVFFLLFLCYYVAFNSLFAVFYLYFSCSLSFLVTTFFIDGCQFSPLFFLKVWFPFVFFSLFLYICPLPLTNSSYVIP